jgi:hypothetical protein
MSRFGILHLKGNTNWLKLSNQHFACNTVNVQNMGSVPPFHEGPTFYAENVFLTYCDKNFVFYWLHSATFPNAKRIYLSSHPCEYDVLHRFPKGTLYLSEDYRRYKTWWAEENGRVIVVPQSKIDADLTQIMSCEKEVDLELCKI